MLSPMGQSDIQRGGSGFGIREKQLIEITHSKEQQRVRVIGLGGEPLRHAGVAPADGGTPVLALETLSTVSLRRLSLANEGGDRSQSRRRHALDASGRAKRLRPDMIQLLANFVGKAADFVECDERKVDASSRRLKPGLSLLPVQISRIARIRPKLFRRPRRQRSKPREHVAEQRPGDANHCPPDPSPTATVHPQLVRSPADPSRRRATLPVARAFLGVSQRALVFGEGDLSRAADAAPTYPLFR